MRLKDKIAIVVGAGQVPGDTIGNGRAAAVLFAREGARLVLVDRNHESALETQALVEAEGGNCITVQADVSHAEDCRKFVDATLEAYGRIDILHNNVGIGAGDDDILNLAEESWDRIMAVNLKGMFLSCRSVLPSMRERRSGAIVNISSIAAVCSASMVAYKTSKAGVNALTHQIASENAKHNIRVNAIMPGLMNTPMAIEGIARSKGIPKEELIRRRDAAVPLGGKMGTAWDVAYAALFLASDEARFITGAILPVDGGQSARIG
ncbi:MAG TPA: SDR family NAD(P)-dependent oxidoreductase [Candidatus Angelobacter sp.]|nr:SDR family NAD(P)-dependent oxidoreductase [Candidatus Angelobacter sp.]